MNQPATTQAAAYLQRALLLLEKPRIRLDRYDKQPIETHPNSWIVGREAIDAEGYACAPESEQACAWCTIGVLRAVTHYDPDPPTAYTYCISIMNLANPAYVATGSKHAQPELNDRATSFEQVRRYFQRAIAKAIQLEAKRS